MTRTPTETKAPEGFRKTGWHVFPSFAGSWRPSKVHLVREGEYRPICGAKRGRHSHLSEAWDMRDQERDAGLCRKCWKAASR